MNTIRTGAALLLLSLFAVGGCDQRATTGSEIKDNAKQNMARAKFTEALLNLEPIKQQVALCYNENGFTGDVQPE